MLSTIILIIGALLLEVFLLRNFFKLIANKEVEQPLYEIGPDHSQKKGTPTMGGSTFIIAGLILLIVLPLLLSITGNSYLLEVVVIFIATLCYGFIGYRDDYLKISKKDNQSGLSPLQKVMLQIIAAVIICLLLILNSHSTSIDLLIGEVDFQLGYFIIVLLFYVGFSNATNITDGLDGLLTSTYIVTMASLSLIAYLEKNLFLFYFGIALISILIIFFLSNRNPAKVFMGDTGSLFLGGIFASYAILLKIELISFFFVAIFLLETLSVIIQVSYFKYTRKKTGVGKKVFLMAPLHHHFEKKGYSENKIVILFVIIQMIFSIFGLYLYLVLR